MKIEEYVSRYNQKTYVKVGIVGVLKDRLEVFNTTFERFEGVQEFGWWQLKVSGIEQPLRVSDQWYVAQPTPMIEGESLEVLLDRVDNVAWKIERASLGVFPEASSEKSPQPDQTQLQAKAAVAETPAANTETKKRLEFAE